MADRIDASEVHDLVQIFAKAPAVAPQESRRVLQKGALNIKTDARKRISGHPTLRRLPAAITYDTHETPGGGWAEIGPDHAKPQGPLGNIPEHGTRNNAPLPYMRPAADAEEPRFAKAMEDLAAKATGLG